ncbi:hypothetical protein [Nonomuraea sp. NPDC005501]|uniref:hypothetical protein n=1 Tax=Nonomuraea sp. NPDC005501 TaxID=3156884 RepID=UPI0033ADE7D9
MRAIRRGSNAMAVAAALFAGMSMLGTSAANATTGQEHAAAPPTWHAVAAYEYQFQCVEAAKKTGKPWYCEEFDNGIPGYPDWDWKMWLLF